HRLGLGLWIDFEGGQAQGNAHRSGIGEAALTTFIGVVFRLLELVMVEVEVRSSGEIDDREHRTERLLEARDVSDLRVGAEELLVALALNLDEVRHLGDFVDVAEDLADSPRVGLEPARGLPGRVDRFGGHVLPCAARRRIRGAPAVVLRPEPDHFWSACPATLSNALDPCAGAGPVPERTGKAPGAHHGAARAEMFG